MNRDFQHLSHLVDSLQAQGKYFVSKKFMIQSLGISDSALRSSIKRLSQKKRLTRLTNGLYLIVPIEYKNIAAPPPEWFIDQLMKEYGTDYYVGLLTAASFHGAAHQQPQIYQVITNKPLRSIKVGRVRIVFYFKKDFKDVVTAKVKTPTGYMNVSSPELTAFDLIRYLKQSGHINHVSTVFSELGEALDPKELAKVATHFPQACVQRAGYILDQVGFKDKTSFLSKYVHTLPSKYYPLRGDKKWDLEEKNKEWHLYINEELETDL